MAEAVFEVLAPSAVEALNRSEIESQIDVAKRYPRSMSLFKTRATEMACIDDDTAQSCIYRRPVGKEGGQMKYAEGMSVRMAEIVGASYGNLRVYATIVDQTESKVVARGMAIDLESNFASSSEIIESTLDKNNKPYSERMRIVVAKAALAKARRDATFQVVPRALAKPVEEAVRKLLHGDSKSIDKRRAQVGQWIKSLGIDEKRVWDALGVKGLADVGLDQLETLTGIRTALKDNETTVDEAFPGEPLKQPEPIAKVETKAETKAATQSAEVKKKKTDELAKDRKSEAINWIETVSDAEFVESRTWLNGAIKGLNQQEQTEICTAWNNRNRKIASELAAASKE